MRQSPAGPRVGIEPDGLTSAALPHHPGVEISETGRPAVGSAECPTGRPSHWGRYPAAMEQSCRVAYRLGTVMEPRRCASPVAPDPAADRDKPLALEVGTSSRFDFPAYWQAILESVTSIVTVIMLFSRFSTSRLATKS